MNMKKILTPWTPQCCGWLLICLVAGLGTSWLSVVITIWCMRNLGIKKDNDKYSISNLRLSLPWYIDYLVIYYILKQHLSLSIPSHHTLRLSILPAGQELKQPSLAVRLMATGACCCRCWWRDFGSHLSCTWCECCAEPFVRLFSGRKTFPDKAKSCTKLGEKKPCQEIQGKVFSFRFCARFTVSAAWMFSLIPTSIPAAASTVPPPTTS